MAQFPHTLTVTPVLPRGTPVTFGMIGNGSFEPVSSGSSGGWQIVDRPRQKAITQWYDASPMSLVLELILDGNGQSIEPQCATLFGWQYPTPGAMQPPVHQVSGPIDAQAKALYWILYVVKFNEDELIRDDGGNRIQQKINLTLYEYVPSSSSVLTQLTPAQAAQFALNAQGTSTSRRTYVCKAGDTLAKIAARVLGNQALWTELAAVNSIRDPANLTPGQRIILPS